MYCPLLMNSANQPLKLLPIQPQSTRIAKLDSTTDENDQDEEWQRQIAKKNGTRGHRTMRHIPSSSDQQPAYEFITSTRALYKYVSNKYTKDPRFWNFGRDERERERAFKNWLQELDKQKRQHLIKAEEDFQKVKDDVRFLAFSSNLSKESMWKNWVEQESQKTPDDEHSNTSISMVIFDPNLL
ncbi:hypothetical protein MJO29_014025 [Puccinia striiformis f. sp. tritici]|nr:hypothetical protein MJO29_014025 [Puccinia striiformis f. sp. tritici]